MIAAVSQAEHSKSIRLEEAKYRLKARAGRIKALEVENERLRAGLEGIAAFESPEAMIAREAIEAASLT